MSTRNLLLCFDAFGTLFWPKPSVAQQYAQVARQCGLTGYSEPELQAHLASAIQHEARVHPNYGIASGLGATQWWANVIHKTFQPVSRNRPLPPDLVPALLARFSSSRGYDVEQDLVATLKRLKHRSPAAEFDRVVVGLITNSDDRVPGVLSSFGLSVSPLRFGGEDTGPPRHHDIDFACMSYDVGSAKPHPAIFRAAEHLAAKVISKSGMRADFDHKLYVGDEHAKDVVGALSAGWKPVLLDPRDETPGIPSLEQERHQPLVDVFETRPVVKVRSIRSLVSWLLRDDDECHDEGGDANSSYIADAVRK